ATAGGGGRGRRRPGTEWRRRGMALRRRHPRTAARADTGGDALMSEMPQTLLEGAGGYAAVPEHHGGVTIAEVLQGAGVGTLFCLPGGHLGAVTDGCGKAGLRIVGTRHESAAVHMAEAWARCTGETGVAGITAGPGFTNCVT